MFSQIKKLYWLLHRPCYWKHNMLEQELTDKIDFLTARNELLVSPLWDEDYYCRHYSTEIALSGLHPLNHYLLQGWEKGYNPSSLFNNNAYLPRRRGWSGNPLVHFLLYGRFMSICGYSSNVYPVDGNYIELYLKEKSKRQTNKVVYTCITNDYDDLNSIRSHSFVSSDWDYVCFSDNPNLIAQKQVGIWEVRPLVNSNFDNSRNNRFHKILPHICLPEYEESIYLDANINVLTPYLFNTIKEVHSDILLPIMIEFPCLYASAKWMIQSNIDKEKLIYQLTQFQNEGFPENYGMFENNLIYRKHHSPEIISMMEQWWLYVRDYCRRDQASLAYVFWKHNRKIQNYTLNNLWADYKDFCVFPHLKQREYINV